ncbi:hypothetical protein F183_A43940 [Bryobacterales bacterium F-183]|nr:hypothetical protein F183_A43940 [Bryobacterales bacterium F-183]
MTREETIAQLYSLVAQPNSALSAADSVRNDVAQLTAPLIGSLGDTLGATGSSSGTGSQLASQLAVITQQLDLLRNVQQAQVDAVAENTSTLASGVASRFASTAASVATNAVGGGGLGGGLLGGFGLSPIVGGLLRLFGFGGSDSDSGVAPLSRYQAPTSLAIDAGLSNGQLSEISRGAGDRVRTVSAPQVTVQVNAMDTQSFLDRSDDIARAVRQAMLESHPINDVVAEL